MTERRVLQGGRSGIECAVRFLRYSPHLPLGLGQPTLPDALPTVLALLPCPFQVFRENDTDGSGILEKGEFHELILGLGFGLSKQDVNHLQKKADKDDDGGVSWAEFADQAEDLLKDIFRRQVVRSLAQSVVKP